MNREPIFNAPSSVVSCLAILAALHVIVWHLLPEKIGIGVLEQMAFIPARYTHLAGASLLEWGAAVWTFVTHQLLHGDITHVLLNCAWLLVFGGPVAVRVGGRNFLALAVASGIAGALCFLAFRFGDKVPMIGASGAAYGLMGAAFRFLFTAIDHGGFEMFQVDPKSIPLASIRQTISDRRFQTAAFVLLAINMFMSTLPSSMAGTDGIAWQAHLGGFLFGFLTLDYFEPRKPRRPDLRIVRPTLH